MSTIYIAIGSRFPDMLVYSFSKILHRKIGKIYRHETLAKRVILKLDQGTERDR